MAILIQNNKVVDIINEKNKSDNYLLNNVKKIKITSFILDMIDCKKQLINDKFNISVSLTTIYSILKNNNYVYKKQLLILILCLNYKK